MRVVALLVLALTGCAQLKAQPELSADQLYFPGAAVVAGGTLLVVSTNFDLRFRAGRVSAFSVADVDAAVDSAVAAAVACAQSPDCTKTGRPASGGLPSPTSSVEVGNFGGQVEAAARGDAFRVFVPIRDGDTVVALELDKGNLTCSIAGDTTCGGVQFPAPDPYEVRVVGPNVYVGHVNVNAGSIGIIGAAEVEAPLWTGGPGQLLAIPLQNTAVGGVDGRCNEVAVGAPPCSAGGRVFASGRATTQDVDLLYAFDFAPGQLITSQVFVGNLGGQQRGADVRGIALIQDGQKVLMATRAPEAVASVDVTTIPPNLPEGCAVPAVQTTPPTACVVGAASPGGAVPSPAFLTVGQIPVPGAPTSLIVLPRVEPGGRVSELAVVASDQALSFIEPRSGAVAARLTALGGVAAQPAFRTFETGFRLYVPLFSTGLLAVVDLPDPFQPSSAVLRAVLGNIQQGAF